MYNKLFGKILDSSVWLESDSTRIVWLTLLASMDETGFCAFAAVGNVAGRARVSPKAAKVALDVLSQPDPNSFDPENEGKRIERVQGGWIVLNAQKYRAIQKRADMQEKTRERVRRFREKKRSGNANVTHRNDSVTPSEAYTEAKTERGSRPVKKMRRRREPAPSLPEHARSWLPAILEALQPVGVRNLEGPRNMIAACLQADPDVEREEILIGIETEIPSALKLEKRGVIRSSTGGLVMGAVPKGVAAGTYKTIRAERDRHRAEAEAIAELERSWDDFQPVAGALAVETWKSILRWIKEQFLLQEFLETWLEPTKGVDLRGDTLYVRVPSPEFLNICDRFSGEIALAIEKRNLPIKSVRFLTTPAELSNAGNGPVKK